jgi:hypothetical protein
MKVYFLGRKLPETIRLLNAVIDMNNKTKRAVSKYLVYHWTPSEITSGSTKYRRVEMPSCELYKNGTENSCRYEILPVLIFFNERVKESDELLDIIKRLHFSSLSSLIEIYEDFVPKIEQIYLKQLANERTEESVEDFYNEIACQWLQQNPKVYNIGNEESWIQTSTDTREISIGGM